MSTYSTMNTFPNEETFIYLGLRKHGYGTGLTPELVRKIIDEPELLDYDKDRDQQFVYAFWHYHDWYWSQDHLKQ